MGFLQRLRGINHPTVTLPPARSSVHHASVTEAMSLAAVYRSVSILATTVEQMPFAVYRGNEQIESRLCDRPDVNTPRPQWLSQIVHSLALYGNAYLWKTYTDDGRVINLTVLKPSQVNVIAEERKNSPIPQVSYYVNGDRASNAHIAHLRLNCYPGEAKGFGPLQSCSPDILTALKLREYGDAFYDVGAPTGVLSTQSPITQEQADGYRAKFEENMSKRSIAVLGAGMEYQHMYVDPSKSQFIENQNFMVTTIARLFGIPPMWLAATLDGTSMTYQNTEQMAISFYQTTLAQYVAAIDEAVSDCLPRGQHAKLKFDALMRSDLTTRTNAYQTLWNIGALTPDEIRASEGLQGTVPNGGGNIADLNLDGAPV